LIQRPPSGGSPGIDLLSRARDRCAATVRQTDQIASPEVLERLEEMSHFVDINSPKGQAIFDGLDEADGHA
jgi:hypothetical protein